MSKAEVQEVVEGLAVKCDHMQMFLFNDSIEVRYNFTTFMFARLFIYFFIYLFIYLLDYF